MMGLIREFGAQWGCGQDDYTKASIVNCRKQAVSSPANDGQNRVIEFGLGRAREPQKL